MTIFHLSRNKITEEEFEKIYKTYFSQLYFFTFQFITDEETSKDIVNDVFEKVWMQRNSYALKESTMSSYLFTLTRNQCIDYLRHKKVEQNYAALYEYLTSEYEDIDNLNLHEERLNIIEKIISELNEPTKGIFTKCYFCNKKYEEVAFEYHMSSSGIKKHIMKVLRMIREEFDLLK